VGPPLRVATVQAVSRLQSALGKVLADLKALKAPAALVGGLAVSSRSEPRFTRDVDLAVAVRQDADAEALVFSLQKRGYRVLASVEQDAARRLATVRLLPPGEPERGVIIDLLFASSGIEAEVVAHADSLEVWPGFLARVATVSDLLALKILARDDARRPQDHADIRALIRRASPDDLAKAREALALISQRGFDRGKNLLSELTSVLTQA
jgi:predicted nucleotidyltransferase